MDLSGTIQDYRYIALPDDRSIRMLILDSGEQGNTLRGSLNAVECNSAGSYESLSYVWGAPEWIHEILIQGEDGGGRIKLTPNLFEALNRLILPDRIRRIWVDQICINQVDWLERSQQNSIWSTNSSISFKLKEPGKSPIDLKQDLEKVLEDGWGPLSHLTDPPWFTRGWVVQEFGTKTPATLVWGASEIDWLILYNVCMKLNDYRNLRCKFKIKTTYLRYIFERFVERDLSNDHANRINFLYELHRARHLKFSDDRDRVFAWLGHYSLRWSNKELGALAADYTKSLIEIYNDVTTGGWKAAKRSLSSSDKSSAPTQHRASQDTLPSWVPDWRTYQNHMLYEPINPHHAHGASSPKLKLDLDLPSLIIHGVEVDTIDMYSRPLLSKEFNIGHADSEGKTAIEYIWRDICQKGRFNLADKYITGEESLFACMQTLGNGCVLMARWEQNPYHETPPSWWLEKEAVYHTDVLGEPQTRAVSGVAKNRIFARTEKGYYVPRPGIMEPGDIICVLFGGKQPFCLRPFGHVYRLVGECYVHGLMNGQAMAMMDRQELTEMAFQIV
ncbi:hypothetical protein CC78DRAFT_580107 [Lojkania enalia]|uniref:Heterokaryon incompatibility domain-containing protein n=1 Tax=Lojkania enalia TaxID=147567 RepID=A0A9P4KA48_9PLEO|nr:hypothetical protein CC78DRAFT_580107 [Didymosphaeria enalia]